MWSENIRKPCINRVYTFTVMVTHAVRSDARRQVDLLLLHTLYAIYHNIQELFIKRTFLGITNYVGSIKIPRTPLTGTERFPIEKICSI